VEGVRFPSAVLLTAHEPLDLLPVIQLLVEYLVLVGPAELLPEQWTGRFVPEGFSVPAPGLVRRVLARIVPPILLLLVGLVLVCGRLLLIPMKTHEYSVPESKD
jgi:hypothetical protein